VRYLAGELGGLDEEGHVPHERGGVVVQTTGKHAVRGEVLIAQAHERPGIGDVRVGRLHPHVRGQTCLDHLRTPASRVLQAVLAAGGRVDALLEEEVAAVGREPAVPVDEGVVGVGGVVHVVGVLDELG
jgi:hypothetical protein